jgi:hypothetical protein
VIVLDASAVIEPLLRTPTGDDIARWQWSNGQLGREYFASGCLFGGPHEKIEDPAAVRRREKAT